MSATSKLPPLAPRLLIVRLLAASLFALLIGRLWYLQVVRGPELRLRAQANTFVDREITPARGVIYDSQGRQVVRNRPRFSVQLIPAALPENAATLNRELAQISEVLKIPVRSGAAVSTTPITDTVEPALLAGDVAPPKLDLSRPSLDRLLRDKEGRIVRTWSPVPLPVDVPRDIAFGLLEAWPDLPGVQVGESSARDYPAGMTLAHLLGFTGSIPEEALEAYQAKDYRIYDTVGRNGLEATYEDDLRGRRGVYQVEVDATGKQLAVTDKKVEPVPGHSLYLSIDLEFQRAAEQALASKLQEIGARSGSVVAIDPRSGAIRALVSLPTYDNNLFTETGTRQTEFQRLMTDPSIPLVNRAISGQYPPGSVYKLVTASAALAEGVITSAKKIVCPGVINIVNQFNASIVYPYVCWQRGGHGGQDVQHAIANSCDVFFYEVSGGEATGRPAQEGLGSARLGKWSELYGLGEPTGVELLGEEDGMVPTPAWLKATKKELWTTGRTYIMGIGQGDMLVTPIQMANVVAAVANGGTLYKPHLVDRVADEEGNVVRQPGGVLRQLPISAGDLANVRQGMRMAVTGGTANPSWAKLPTQIPVAGKTGTAEFCDWAKLGNGSFDCRRDKDGHLLTHAWFVSFAPYDNPEIALAVMVDGSGLNHIIEGSQVAAPVAGDVLRAYFHLPPLLPPTPLVPTTPPAPPTEAACRNCPPPAGGPRP